MAARQVIDPILLTLRKGDFVQSSGWFGDVWAEVLDTFGGDSEAILMAARNERGSEYTFLDSLRPKVHRSGMPWAPHELRILHCKTGTFGDRNGPPLPEWVRPTVLETIALAANEPLADK